MVAASILTKRATTSPKQQTDDLMDPDVIVLAMRDGDLKTLKAFIETLDTINQYVHQDLDSCLNLLHLAAGLESDYREAVIELLLEHRADLNFPSKSDGIDDVRALHLASMWGYDLTVKLLLYHGADASLRDSEGMSAIDYATVYDNYLCISLLIRYGSLNSTTTAWNAIMDSSLAESTADSSFENFQYYTALDFGGDEPEVLALPPAEERRQTHTQHRVNFDLRVHKNSIQSDYDDDYEEVEADDEDYDPLATIKDDELDLNIDNKRLRLELRRLGRTPGPITDTTKRLYCKLLARLAKDDKELVYSPRTAKKTESNGYSTELNSILTGRFSIRQALDLEKEFIRSSSTNRGTKQCFNYILLDPRITQNLPEQALDASDSDTSRMTSPDNEHTLTGRYDTKQKHVMGKVNRKFSPNMFKTFLSAIFYIGKGTRTRDLMHLYDALIDRESITHKKIQRIKSIWADGYGIISLHMAHNISDHEALSREALMIEAIGLTNLTNLLRGSFKSGVRLDWGEHQRMLLGALLLYRAFMQYMNEGERQLRRADLKHNYNNNNK